MSEPYELSRNFVTANDIAFHYALDGDSSNPVLALVNMATVNLTHWEHVLPGLVDNFRVLRFDIRGTGKSGWGADREFTFAQYADDLAAIMDALEIADAFVLGVAYGARTAAQFALRHEHRLTALGLFDASLTPPVAQSGQRELAERARELLRDAGEAEMPMRKSWRFYENREAALKAHTAHESEPDTTELLSCLKISALVACGRQDLNLEESRRIAATLATSKLHIMEMTGHGSPLFRPQMVASIITGFFRENIL